MGSGGRLSERFDAEQWDSLSRAIRQIGPDVTPATIRASGDLIAPLHGRPTAGVTVRRDEPYGPHERHRLDVFLPQDRYSNGVAIFVHGGAFVGGSKHAEGSPYHDNIGSWCASTGRAAVTMNYRLAPEAPWPAGAEDIDRAIAWCRGNLDGATGPVHLAGTSSGAVHVATYLTGGPGWRRSSPLPASAAFFSGVYDLRAFGTDRIAPYFGDAPSFLAGETIAQALVAVPVPMLFVVGEWDTPEANAQFAHAVAAFAAAGHPLPHLVRARAANHFTVVNAIGTPADEVGPAWALLMEGAETRIPPR